MSITPSTTLRMQFNRSGREPREKNMRNYFSTRAPFSILIQALGNSERGQMTGKEDNVGFRATGSGVKQFQLSFQGWFVRGARCSLAPGAYPLSGSGSAPAGLRNLQPSTTLPHTGDARAGARLESTLLADWALK